MRRAVLCLITGIAFALPAQAGPEKSWTLDQETIDRLLTEQAAQEAKEQGLDGDREAAAGYRLPGAPYLPKDRYGDYLPQFTIGPQFEKFEGDYDYAGDCDRSGRTRNSCYLRMFRIRQGDFYATDDLFWRQTIPLEE
ncbi:MAG: hypothetical protein MI755_17845 [Sphingomonadales bacterium]|nr:hypothetical protein [Sphingomonadales bacterium]